MPINPWIKNVFFYNAVNITTRSKISINSNSRFKFVNPRVTEVMSCGTFLLTDYNDDLKKFDFNDFVTFKKFCIKYSFSRAWAIKHRRAFTK